jgi:hypothetical protein
MRRWQLPAMDRCGVVGWRPGEFCDATRLRRGDSIRYLPPTGAMALLDALAHRVKPAPAEVRFPQSHYHRKSGRHMATLTGNILCPKSRIPICNRKAQVAGAAATCAAPSSSCCWYLQPSLATNTFLPSPSPSLRWLHRHRQRRVPLLKLQPRLRTPRPLPRP